MGKQTLLHMTAADRLKLFTYAHEELGLQFGRRDGSTEAVVLLLYKQVDNEGTFCIWDQLLCPDLKRTWVPDPGYYRVDTLTLPVMEYLPSVDAEWNNKPALCQGRLFANFELRFKKPKQFLAIYKTLVLWIKKEYRRAPAGLDGYVGPSAWEFYSGGGYLLPLFVPPKTVEWQRALGKQHLNETHSSGANAVSSGSDLGGV